MTGGVFDARRGRGTGTGIRLANSTTQKMHTVWGLPCPGLSAACFNPLLLLLPCLPACLCWWCDHTTQVMKSVQTPYQRLRLGDSNLVVALDKHTQVHSTGGRACIGGERHQSRPQLGTRQRQLAQAHTDCSQHAAHLSKMQARNLMCFVVPSVFLVLLWYAAAVEVSGARGPRHSSTQQQQRSSCSRWRCGPPAPPPPAPPRAAARGSAVEA